MGVTHSLQNEYNNSDKIIITILRFTLCVVLVTFGLRVMHMELILTSLFLGTITFTSKDSNSCKWPKWSIQVQKKHVKGGDILWKHDDGGIERSHAI